METLEQKISKLKTYYVNSDITSDNFPKPEKIRDFKDFHVIEMKKSFTSEEGLAKMKKQGCSPANIWEIVEYAEKLEKGKWYIALDSKDNLWKDSDGSHRVPHVHARTDGGFEFSLGYFGRGWGDDDCLLCVRDLPLDTQTLGNTEPLTLSSSDINLERAIGICVMNGYQVIKNK